MSKGNFPSKTKLISSVAGEELAQGEVDQSFLRIGDALRVACPVSDEEALVVALSSFRLTQRSMVRQPILLDFGAMSNQELDQQNGTVGIVSEHWADLEIDGFILPGLISLEGLTKIRDSFAKLDYFPWIFVRVDSEQAVTRLELLLSSVEGVMISRLELTSRSNLVSVPIICKKIIQSCNQQAKLAIIASDMLSSMRTRPTPTRAEVSDIANAVIDGADAIVLSEDLLKGRYPDRATQICKSIFEDLEDSTEISANWRKQEIEQQTIIETVAFHAYKTAERIHAKAIVCITKEGHTALHLARYRSHLPIIAVTFSEMVRSRLSLIRGVSSMVLEVDPSIDEVLPSVNDLLKSSRHFERGDQIVLVTVSLSPVGRVSSNLLTVQKVY